MTNSGFTEWGRAAAGQGRNLGDRVIYYRRPVGPDKADSGWIVWGDSASGTKLQDRAILGFEPLMKYGRINDPVVEKQAEIEGWSQARREWHQILSHPDGPAEFPVQQILTFRWYRPEECPEPGVFFPQLNQKVKEYRCPECMRKPFIDIDGVGGVTQLGAHLRIQHKWDRVSLMAYGERVGIDFNKIDVGDGSLVTEYETTAPSTESLTCPDCGEVFDGIMAAAHLGKHRAKHPQVEIETVGA